MRHSVTRAAAAIAAIAAAAIAVMAFAGASEAGQQIFRNNARTSSHVMAPGTHTWIVPPSGASKAAGFRGFEIPSRGIRLDIVEYLEGWETQKASFTKEALETQGLEVSDISPVRINNMDGVFVIAKRGSARALVLAFGGSGASVSLRGTYREDDPTAANLLQTSMLTAILDTTTKASQAADGYKISTSGTQFELDDETNFTRRYRVKGSEADDGSASFTSTVIMRAMPPDQWQGFAADTFSRFMAQVGEYTAVAPKSAGAAGLTGFESSAEFEGATRRRRTASGAMRHIKQQGKAYQLVLFGRDGRIFVFQGIATRDADNFMHQFRRMAMSLTLQ